MKPWTMFYGGIRPLEKRSQKQSPQQSMLLYQSTRMNGVLPNFAIPSAKTLKRKL